MTKRIYLVLSTRIEEKTLVRASGRGAALRHVAAKTLSVEVASQEDFISMVQSGAKVEDAGEEIEQESGKELGAEPHANGGDSADTRKKPDVTVTARRRGRVIP